MQTLSNLQRNSFNKDNLELVTIFLLLLIYESLTSIYAYLSPLFGVSFIYWLKLYDKKVDLKKILLYSYILYYEIDKDFFVLSFIPLFIVIRYMVVSFSEKVIDCSSCKIIIYMISIYIGYFLLNLFLGYVFISFIPSIGKEYIFYILIDILIVKMVFNEK